MTTETTNIVLTPETRQYMEKGLAKERAKYQAKLLKKQQVKKEPVS